MNNNLVNQELMNIDLYNKLYYELENDSWCCVRPSGTEPKIKLYIGTKGLSDEDANIKLENLKESILSIIK